MSGEVLTQRRRGAESGVATYVRLGDVCEQVRGVSYKPTDASLEPKEGYVPLLRANNIFEGVINHDDLVFVRQDCILASQYLRQGDVLVCTSSGSVKLVGKAAQIQANSHESFGAFCRVLRPNARLSARYFHHYLQSDTYRRTISNKAAGANINNIRSEDLDELSIPLPPLTAQRRIAAKLDRLCDIIAKRKQQLVWLQQLVKSRFVEMFGDMATNSKGWPMVKMAEVIGRIGNGRSFVCESFARTGDNPAILKLGAATWGVYKPEENKALKAGATYYPDCEVKPGDLLFTRKNTIDLVGKCAYVRETPPRLMLPDLIFRLETNQRIDKVYLANLINHDGSRAAIQRLASGSAGSMPNISKARLLGLMIPLPPLALQREFAAFVAKVDKLAFAVRESLESAEKLYRQQLSEAFS